MCVYAREWSNNRLRHLHPWRSRYQLRNPARREGCETKHKSHYKLKERKERQKIPFSRNLLYRSAREKYNALQLFIVEEIIEGPQTSVFPKRI